MTAVPLDPIVSQPCVLDRHPDCLEPHICGCDCHRAPAARRSRWWTLPHPARCGRRVVGGRGHQI